MADDGLYFAFRHFCCNEAGVEIMSEAVKGQPLVFVEVVEDISFCLSDLVRQLTVVHVHAAL